MSSLQPHWGGRSGASVSQKIPGKMGSCFPIDSTLSDLRRNPVASYVAFLFLQTTHDPL
jgi:hypothetical protein